MTDLVLRATRGVTCAYLTVAAAAGPADGAGVAARAVDARFISEAAIIAAASPLGAAHAATAFGFRAATGLAAHQGCGTAALCRALLPVGTAPTQALPRGWTACALDAAIAVSAAGSATCAIIGTAGVPGTAVPGRAALTGADAFRGAAATCQARCLMTATGVPARMFRGAALAAGAHLARLTADVPTLTDDGHASLRCAGLVVRTATAMACASSRTAPILRANSPLAAAGIAALVL